MHNKLVALFILSLALKSTATSLKAAEKSIESERIKICSFLTDALCDRETKDAKTKIFRLDKNNNRYLLTGTAGTIEEEDRYFISEGKYVHNTEHRVILTNVTSSNSLKKAARDMAKKEIWARAFSQIQEQLIESETSPAPSPTAPTATATTNKEAWVIINISDKTQREWDLEALQNAD